MVSTFKAHQTFSEEKTFIIIYVETKTTLETIENLMNMVELAVFVEQVDYSEYPIYLEEVAYPVYLELVRDRLKNSFYRRLDSVKFDLDLIRLNAMAFNTEGSFIHTFAEQHMKDLLNFNPENFEAGI